MEQAELRFEQALMSPNVAFSLEHLARSLKAEGMDHVSLYCLFEFYQVNVDGDDLKYDAIADTMDLIWGGSWAKGRALFDRELTDEDLRHWR